MFYNGSIRFAMEFYGSGTIVLNIIIEPFVTNRAATGVRKPKIFGNIDHNLVIFLMG